MITRLKAWLSVTSPVSSFLLTGWVVFFASLLSQFEIPASGGMLVASAILGELYLSNNWRYGRFVSAISQIHSSGISTSGVPFSMDADFECDPSTGNNFRVTTGILRFDFLQQLRLDRDIVSGIWRPAKTINRLKRVLVRFIAANAVVGTLVWAYGHRFTV